MCVIIDANLVWKVFTAHPDKEFLPVFLWLHRKDGCMVIGGHLASEIRRVRGAARYVVELESAGKARRLPAAKVGAEESRLKRNGACKSDDPHVIALARLSGARTLCSHDKDLHDDFKNPRLISNPKGRIYQNASHKGLLKHTTSCGLL